MSPNGGQDNSLFLIRWMQVGVVAGFLVCLIYPALIVLQPMNLAGIVMVVAFGPLLSIASFGLRAMMSVHRRTMAADAAAIMNTIGGALFSTMLLLQFAEPMFTGAERAQPDIVAIWLTLDVVWDVYIGLGTVMFALAMFHHPRFGWPFSIPGIIIALLLLAFNLYTFPKPPANSGLIDIGPLLGLWYLAVSIQMLRSISWAKRTLGTSLPSN